MSGQLHLLFAVEEPDLDTAAVVNAFVARLNGDREWCCGPLSLVDEVDDEVATQLVDAPVWTLGGVLTLAAPGDDRDVEKGQLADVEFLVEQLAQLSQPGYAFEIEYGGELVGSIAAGAVDRSITEGLIEPWRKRVQAP